MNIIRMLCAERLPPVLNPTSTEQKNKMSAMTDPQNMIQRCRVELYRTVVVLKTFHHFKANL